MIDGIGCSVCIYGVKCARWQVQSGAAMVDWEGRGRAPSGARRDAARERKENDSVSQIDSAAGARYDTLDRQVRNALERTARALANGVAASEVGLASSAPRQRNVLSSSRSRARSGPRVVLRKSGAQGCILPRGDG